MGYYHISKGDQILWLASTEAPSWAEPRISPLQGWVVRNTKWAHLIHCTWNNGLLLCCWRSNVSTLPAGISLRRVEVHTMDNGIVLLRLRLWISIQREFKQKACLSSSAGHMYIKYWNSNEYNFIPVPHLLGSTKLVHIDSGTHWALVVNMYMWCRLECVHILALEFV